jgi:hypothetical protein
MVVAKLVGYRTICHKFLTVLRIRDVYPGSRILDPKTAKKERGEKILFEYLF